MEEDGREGKKKGEKRRKVNSIKKDKRWGDNERGREGKGRERDMTKITKRKKGIEEERGDEGKDGEGKKTRKLFCFVYRSYFLSWQVVIAGVAGTSYQGDIAIDDVSFSSDCVVGGTIPGAFSLSCYYWSYFFYFVTLLLFSCVFLYLVIHSSVCSLYIIVYIIEIKNRINFH